MYFFFIFFLFTPRFFFFFFFFFSIHILIFLYPHEGYCLYIYYLCFIFLFFLIFTAVCVAVLATWYCKSVFPTIYKPSICIYISISNSLRNRGIYSPVSINCVVNKQRKQKKKSKRSYAIPPHPWRITKPFQLISVTLTRKNFAPLSY